VVESQWSSSYQGATTTTTIDGAHNEHEAHGDVNTSHKAVSHDVAKAAEHEEHLTHVLHQLQNKPCCVLCCLFVFLRVLALCYSTGGTSRLVSSFV
jgi:hypothetical protein